MKEKYFRLLIILISTFFYLTFLCPSVGAGDSGELVASAYTLGIPHPPGYPFYMILGRLFSTIFPSNPALGMNILSSVFAILSVVLLFQILVDLDVLPQIAFILSLLLSIHPLFFNYATIAEVYTITSFFFLLELFLLTKKRYKLLSYILGLSFFIHPLLWIIGLYTLYKILKEDYRLLIYSLLGFSIILYLPIRSNLNPLIDWGNPETFIRLLSHILRFEYYREGSVPFTFSIIFKELTIWIKILLRDANFLLLLLPFAFKCKKREYLLFLLIYSFPLALLLHFDPDDLNLEANRVFFLPQLILIIILSVSGLKRVKKKFLPIVGAFLLTSFILLGYKERLYNRSWTAYDYLTTVLRQVEDIHHSYPIPVIQSRGDALTFPLLYTEVLTERLKVRVNTPGLKIHTDEIPNYSTCWDGKFRVYDRMLFSKKKGETKPWIFNVRQGGKDILEDELYIKALCHYAVYLHKRGRIGLSLSVLEKTKKIAWLNHHRIVVISAYSEIKHHEESVDILQSIQRVYPDYPGIYHSLYYSLAEMGNTEEAEMVLSKGLLTQDDKDLLNDAGVYYAGKGFTNNAFLFFLKGVFKGTAYSGTNLNKLIQREILKGNIKDYK